MPTRDPFLFCVHHDDAYPEGNGQFGPATSLKGRAMGQDFSGKDGFSMYHGLSVPGFPRHPHRGFETVTVVRRGLLDHADSMGAAARYGRGDVQWLTAGAGIQHAEMFPLLHADAKNPLELFQIWLNLPAKQKMARPHFAMLWAPTIPTLERTDAQGRAARITLHAGALGDAQPPPPPPESWASDPNNHVMIWTIKLAPQAELELPPLPAGVNASIYVLSGKGLTVGEQATDARQYLELASAAHIKLRNGDAETELLWLAGRPIAEPVAHYGPFVMNTERELQVAFADYRANGFGGWPWSDDAPVHGDKPERFARHADGRTEKPG